MSVITPLNEFPKLSLFTPTHDPKYLLEAFESVIANSYQGQWEWVLVPNHGGTIPEQIAQHPNVRVVPAPDCLHGIGALKLFACTNCTGDWLLELDHDDMLTDDCLKCVGQAAVEHKPGFIYSDCVHFYYNNSSQVFSSDFGWQSYPFVYKGVSYQALRNFPLTPASLQTISFAPNHIRCWNRELYLTLGGHNPALEVADDHDLLCRTYLHGAKFHWIDRPLYLYRIIQNGGNSYAKNQQALNRLQTEVSDKYFQQLLVEWCRRENYTKIDLGGRIGCPSGFLSVDLQDADYNIDVAACGLPFDDSSIGVVRANDFLEHMPACSSRCEHRSCVVRVMNEIYRVLVPGGWLTSSTPSTDGRGAFQDPTHTSFWNTNSLWYYTRRDQQQYVPGITTRFQGTRVKNDYPTPWHRQHNIVYMYADLAALKGQHQPGLQEV